MDLPQAYTCLGSFSGVLSPYPSPPAPREHHPIKPSSHRPSKGATEDPGTDPPSPYRIYRQQDRSLLPLHTIVQEGPHVESQFLLFPADTVLRLRRARGGSFR